MNDNMHPIEVKSLEDHSKWSKRKTLDSAKNMLELNNKISMNLLGNFDIYCQENGEIVKEKLISINTLESIEISKKIEENK